VADQAVNKMIDKAAETAKDEVKALKSAEAAFAAASEELTKPVARAIDAVIAPAPVKASAKPAARKAPAKARRAKPAAMRSVAKAAAKPAKAAPKRKIVARKTNKQAPVRKAAAALNQGVKTMNKQTNKAAEIYGADRFQAAFGDINERAKAATERSAKMVEEMTDLTRGNVEAIVASSKVAQKGLETLSQDAAEFGRKSFEEASATLKSFTEIKSATDFFRLQGDYARSAFDAAIAQSARMSEQMMKIAGDAAEPINSRYTVAADRVKTLVAA
jgi:phasin family protein